MMTRRPIPAIADARRDYSGAALLHDVVCHGGAGTDLRGEYRT